VAVVLYYVQIFPMTSKPSGHPYVVRLNDRAWIGAIFDWEEQVFIAAELKASAGAAKKIGPM